MSWLWGTSERKILYKNGFSVFKKGKDSVTQAPAIEIFDKKFTKISFGGENQDPGQTENGVISDEPLKNVKVRLTLTFDVSLHNVLDENEWTATIALGIGNTKRKKSQPTITRPSHIAVHKGHCALQTIQHTFEIPFLYLDDNICVVLKPNLQKGSIENSKVQFVLRVCTWQLDVEGEHWDQK